MQSLAPSNTGEGDKIDSNVASVSCHASTARLKSKHAESHGDKKTGLGDKKPSSLLLKQNTNQIQKPVVITRPLQKPEIPACIEACDVGSLLDKFLEYELNQSATVNMAKNSSVALTPASSPSHKSTGSCNLTEALNRNKKISVSSAIGLTPPVSPPSHQSTHSVTNSSPTIPTTSFTTHDKSKDQSSLPTRRGNESKKQDEHAVNSSSLEKVTLYNKAPSDAKMKNTSELQHTTRQNVSSKTPEKSRNGSYQGNRNIVEESTKNCGSGQHKSQETEASSLQFLQEKEKKLPKSSSGYPVDKRVNDNGCRNLKRCYSSDEDNDNDDKDYYDYKRKKYYAARDECYWSTSEDESDDERGKYCSRKQGLGENSYRRSRRSRCSSSESDGNPSTYRKSRSHTSNDKERGKNTESKKENCIQKAPVYDIETERKKNFKLDRSFKETAMEKRKIVYIGNIKESMSKNDVWRRFRVYGPIEKVTVHYRNDGDNYSFVTFVDSSSALEAIEKGSKHPDLKHLDICFGGRRKFCGGSYVDFDSNTSYLEEKQMNGDVSSSQSKNEEMDFDALLKMCQRKSR